MGAKARTDYLAASPSAFSGAARLLDWFGDFDEYNTSQSGVEADARAMLSDWVSVGDDLGEAMAEFEATHPA